MLARFFDREVKTQQFSDTVVFYAPIGNKYQDVALGRVHLMTMLACSLMLSMLAGKNPVRGSLCVGHGIEFGEGDFYGPALARAHYLEDEKAKQPRILVDDSVINLLSQTGKFSQDAMVEAVMQCYAEKIHSLVQCDKDGSRIVDYAGAGLHDVLGGDEKTGSVFEAAYAFVCVEREKFWNDPEYRDAPKYDELRERYALFEEYLTERLPLWRGDEAGA